MFPLGTVGRDMMYNLVTSYLLTFVLFTRQLDAAQLSAITAIMVAAVIVTDILCIIADPRQKRGGGR